MIDELGQRLFLISPSEIVYELLPVLDLISFEKVIRKALLNTYLLIRCKYTLHAQIRQIFYMRPNSKLYHILQSYTNFPCLIENRCNEVSSTEIAIASLINAFNPSDDIERTKKEKLMNLIDPLDIVSKVSACVLYWDLVYSYSSLN